MTFALLKKSYCSSKRMFKIVGLSKQSFLIFSYTIFIIFVDIYKRWFYEPLDKANSIEQMVGGLLVRESLDVDEVRVIPVCCATSTSTGWGAQKEGVPPIYNYVRAYLHIHIYIFDVTSNLADTHLSV